jgi:hypothetical protein
VSDPAALLITGTVGAGKTTVAEAVGDALAARGVPHAVIDLDWLRRCWPSPPGDPFNGALTLRNLRAVTQNFRAAGATRLVLAGVLESRAERDDHERAVGMPLVVCRLTVDLPTVRQRLLSRHDPRWYLDRSGELHSVLEQAEVEDVVVDASTAAVPDVAAAVLTAVGW